MGLRVRRVVWDGTKLMSSCKRGSSQVETKYRNADIMQTFLCKSARLVFEKCDHLWKIKALFGVRVLPILLSSLVGQ